MRRRKPGAGLVAVALCLGGALTACGGGDGEGYAAVGAGPSPKGAVAPSGVVTLVPLESPSASGTTSSTSSPSPAAPGASGTSSTGPDGAPPGHSGTSGGPGSSGTPGSSRTDASPGTGPETGTAGGSGSGPGPGSAPTTAPGSGTGTPPRTPSATPRPSAPGTPSPVPTTPPGPAVLTVSAPGLADGDRRWCQRVTVTFRNTGGSAVTSGTAGFSTHIIGLLGTDWATVDSRQPLPAPIAPGTARAHTYTVCVDSWRVPLGMRIDTREVTAAWS
ncbi:hypothetical protein ACFV2S_12875 [Streptomyces sp. NPDC059695]|uniref:hypothetical protein n=1 Tax=Streptomyces sp. NPDC059695 TaxID=3346910 RepID=UPI0036C93A72